MLRDSVENKSLAIVEIRAYLSLRALWVSVQELRDVRHDGLLVGGGFDVDVLKEDAN